MTDIAAAVNEVRDFLVYCYGDKSGEIRGRTNNFLGKIAAQKLYESLVHLSDAEQAPAFNKLSYEMRRLGYGDECILFAQISKQLDKENKAQFYANMGFEAYAYGLIKQEYAIGLQQYELLDAIMESQGTFDATAQIKSLQNRGQIYHRMGMADPVHYDTAIKCFEDARAIAQTDMTLDKKTANQFLGQIGYCYAKTLTHKARVDIDNASELLDQAFGQITIAMDFVSNLQGFEFEKACFKAVLGDVYLAMGDTDTAVANLEQALEAQKKYGPTLVPRIASTMLKIQNAKGTKMSHEEEMIFYGKLVLFHGGGAYQKPDLEFYARADRPAVAQHPRMS